MKKSTILLVSVILITALLTTWFGYAMYESQELLKHSFGDHPSISIPREKLSVMPPFINGTKNAVFVEVASVSNSNSTITLISGIFRNNNHVIKANSKMNYTVLSGEFKTLKIDCTLASGNYTLTLLTKFGGAFTSASFAIP